MAFLLSERIVNAVGTGEDPAELTVLDTLDALIATATELNVLAGATNANAGTGKAVILGTTGAVTIPGPITVGSTAISEAEIGVLDSASAANSGTGKALITGTSGAVALVTPTVSGTTTLVGKLQAPVVIADATPYTVLAANSGRMHIIGEQTSSITINLPVIATGMYYEFIMGGVATEAQNWVFVATTPSFLNAGVAWTDLNDAESNLAVVYGNGSSHLTLTVTTPAAGTKICFYANATPEWTVWGQVISDSTPAFT